jgi:hypothetical protein
VIVRALESVGRAVIRFLEELGRFFGMLGRILASRDSFFVGAGIRWGDDDMKYLAGSIPTR